jgi:hypothetical protein
MIKFDENRYYQKTEAHGWARISAKEAQKKIENITPIVNSPRYKVWMLA